MNLGETLSVYSSFPVESDDSWAENHFSAYVDCQAPLNQNKNFWELSLNISIAHKIPNNLHAH